MEKTTYYTVHMEGIKRVDPYSGKPMPKLIIERRFPSVDDAFMQLFTLQVSNLDRGAFMEGKTDHLIESAYVAAKPGAFIAYLRLIDAPTKSGLVVPRFFIEVEKPALVNNAMVQLKDLYVRIENDKRIPIGQFHPNGHTEDFYNRNEVLSRTIGERLRNKYYALEYTSTAADDEINQKAPRIFFTRSVYESDYRKCLAHLVQLDLENMHPATAAKNRAPLHHTAIISNPHGGPDIVEASLIAAKDREANFSTKDALYFIIHEDVSVLTTRRTPELYNLPHESHANSRLIATIERVGVAFNESFQQMKASLIANPELVERKRLQPKKKTPPRSSTHKRKR